MFVRVVELSYQVLHCQEILVSFWMHVLSSRHDLHYKTLDEYDSHCHCLDNRSGRTQSLHRRVLPTIRETIFAHCNKQKSHMYNCHHLIYIKQQLWNFCNSQTAYFTK